MLTPDSSLSPVRLSCVWTFKERDPETGLFLPIKQVRNVMTNAGLTNFAGAWQGTPWNAPIYMVVDTYAGTIQNVGGIGVGATSVQLNNAVDLAGDSSIILGVGTANQETIPFSARSGTGPYTYTISATTKTHAQNDRCCRVPLQTDTVASIQSEAAYDPANNPGQRLTSLGGFSPGTAQWTMQFFFTGTQALVYIVTAGLADNSAVGGGNLHNHVVAGIDHTTTGNDLELDVALTLSN